MVKDRLYLKRYNDYMKHGEDKSLSEFMYHLHNAYKSLDAEEKERSYLYTLNTFPETMGYAMLKLSSVKLNVFERFEAEYRDSYKKWLEDIETDLCVGFGDDKVFLTYAKLYICGMTDCVDALSKKIEDTFKKRKEEKERTEWIHKKIF